MSKDQKSIYIKNPIPYHFSLTKLQLWHTIQYLWYTILQLWYLSVMKLDKFLKNHIYLFQLFN